MMILPVIVFGILFAIVIGGNVYAFHLRRRGPQMAIRATIVAKGSQITEKTRFSDHPQREYFVTFETYKGQRMVMRVRPEVYESLFEGDEGRLVHYRGEEFAGFVPYNKKG